jgi:hypothetical protein
MEKRMCKQMSRTRVCVFVCVIMKASRDMAACAFSSSKHVLPCCKGMPAGSCGCSIANRLAFPGRWTVKPSNDSMSGQRTS